MQPCPAKPSIVGMKPSYKVGIGGSITLDCTVLHSYPDVSDLWWVDSQGTRINTGRFSGGTTINPSLTITGVVASDSGYYHCNAKNSIGTSTAFTYLSTGYYPNADITLDHYVSTKGTNVSVLIECKVEYGDNLTWYKENKTLQRNNKYNPGNVNHSYLVISGVEIVDRGVYKCYVENTYGSQSDETCLKVVHTENPSLVYENTANESVTLQCDVYDATEVNWRHNGVKINFAGNRYYGGNITVPSLTIFKLSRDDSGLYQCESFYESVSSIGSGIKLTIRDKPLVKSANEYIQATIGRVITIPCVFDSYPSPTNVFWRKDDIILNTSNSIKYNGSSANKPELTIYNIDKTDYGIYVCFVENQIGISSGNGIRLAVQDPPDFGSIVGPVAGGISAVIMTGLVLIVLLLFTKRRKTIKTNEERTSITHQPEFSVMYRHEVRNEGLYINIGDRNVVSVPETYDNFPAIHNVQQNTDDGLNTYYNVNDVLTTVSVENLKAYIAEKEINDGLKKEYKKIPYGMQYPTTHAQLKENIPKNRFKTTFPYDHSRVILPTVQGPSNFDYINANYVDGFEKNQRYIAAQGPIKQTVKDHWRMIWQNNTRQIVMLTNLVEDDKVKCEMYWPTCDKPLLLGNMVLTLESEKERAAYTTREIYVEDKKLKEKRSVIQYHFTAWPDHGTPDPLYLVLFHKHVRADHYQLEDGPILVHCSAGIGRTGTFIALDALLEEGRSTGNIDIVKFVKKMRYCRMNMIQTADQYVCLHHALLEGFTMEDTCVTKENFCQFWREIQHDKSPINQQKLNEVFKELNRKKLEHEGDVYKVATSTENICKNRNKNVLPMENNRVILVSFEKGRTNYINAVQVPSYTKFVGYITTQLPLPDTKIDFWTMIRDHRSSTIVLILNDCQEADLVYSASGDCFTCGPFDVKIKRKDKNENNITEATLFMTKKDEKPREIALYQTICKDRPNPQDLCRLHNLLSTRISMSSDPITVVSCDGAKNCGLFCTFTNAVSSMQTDAKADILQLARQIQLKRPEFFSDFEEYRLVYEAMNFYLESTNVYAN